MTSRDNLRRRLDHVESEADPGVITLEDVYEWMSAVKDDDAGRPTDYFPENAEWADALQETHAMAVTRAPEFEHLTPAESYVLTYMDEDSVDAVWDALSEDPPEEFVDAVESSPNYPADDTENR